jgi:hypothetical protein
MRISALLIVAIVLSGCAAKQQREADAADSNRWRATDEAVVNTLTESVRNPRSHAGQITHIVLMWLKQPGDAAGIEKIIRTSREFANIPGVVSVRAGRALPSTRPVVDSTFDVGLSMTFTDAAALQAYEVHPQHVKAVREVLRPLAARILVYDVTEADIKEAGAATTTPASK